MFITDSEKTRPNTGRRASIFKHSKVQFRTFDIHTNADYTGLLLSGKLNAHLEEIDRTANEMFESLVKQYAAREGVTEKLKAENQMEWVRRMNGIRIMVEETIQRELIQ